MIASLGRFRPLCIAAGWLVALPLIVYLLSRPECEPTPCQRGDFGPNAICTMICQLSPMYALRVPLALAVLAAAMVVTAVVVIPRRPGRATESRS